MLPNRLLIFAIILSLFFALFQVDSVTALKLKKAKRKYKLLKMTKALMLPFVKGKLAKGPRIIYSAPTIKFEDEFYIG